MGPQNSRTDNPPRAGGGGARARRSALDPQSGRREATDPPAEPWAAAVIRAGSQKRSGAVLTARKVFFSSYGHSRRWSSCCRVNSNLHPDRSLTVLV